jgi:chloramphenicol-sensitive protein RarD
MQRPPTSAVLGAVLAFGFWGVLPIYWKQLSHVGADLTVAHRVVWTMVTVLPLLWWRREWTAWTGALKVRANLATHAWSGLLLTINWGTFIWAANHDRIVDCSLGYFINPLLNVFIGSLLLGETMRPLQKASIGFAAIGVGLQILAVGRFPWIGLILALSMAFYGLARRRSALGSLSGLATETLVFVPVAAGYLMWAQGEARPLWGRQDPHDLLCIGALGVFTALPLLGFAHAARNLPFALLGLLQFLAPTGQFLTGVLIYGEPFTRRSLISFAFIWIGVGLFCFDLWHRWRAGNGKAAG